MPDYDEHYQKVLPTIEARIEELREQVLDAGGLFIIGTERHESRRIDNQLRGRSGRQGDPGESSFFLSAQDDLVRLFAGERIYKILDRLGTTDDEGNEEPIEAGMLSKQIEKAQRRSRSSTSCSASTRSSTTTCSTSSATSSTAIATRCSRDAT